MSQLNLIIEENCGIDCNRVYEAATTYLRTIVRDSTSPKFHKVSKTIKQKRPTADIVVGELVIDSFREIKTLKWKLCAKKDVNSDDLRYFVLSFDKKFKEFVLDSYLSHVSSRSEAIQEAEREVKLYSCECGHGGGEWSFIILEHPATFEKLTRDPEQKRKLIDDLKKFVEIRSCIRELARLGSEDSDFRRILLSTSNRSIMVIEDIDCGAVLDNREQGGNFQIQISGCKPESCGDERIIVFTTNHKDWLDMLDHALLRPSGIDMHVNMSYSTMDGFKLLASTYLRIEGDH
uniref:AAA-type ATPase N-terminal domain-containing protein n=1 Tax=Quercus lobata TaxID=97700 RepID=A0A7N2M4L6_QUELO